jgi:hypothetical protein
VKNGGWGFLFSLKTAVAEPECTKQAETRLAGFPTILGAGRFNLRATRAGLPEPPNAGERHPEVMSAMNSTEHG